MIDAGVAAASGRRRPVPTAARGLVLVAALLGVLTGCAGGSPSAEPSNASAPGSPAPTRQPPDRATRAPAEAPAEAGTPALGSSTTTATTGYGSIRPAEIDGGQDSAGIVSDVRWSSWGGPRATGTGTALYVAPDRSNAQGTREEATVVAFELGRCDGRPAYRKLTWYFPTHGEQLDTAHALDICDV